MGSRRSIPIIQYTSQAASRFQLISIEPRKTKMLLNDTVQEAINEQINNELFAMYSYLSMSAYCEYKQFRGCAHWMRLQSQEEYVHAMRLYDFMIVRQARVKLKPIAQPEVELIAMRADQTHAPLHLGVAAASQLVEKRGLQVFGVACLDLDVRAGAIRDVCRARSGGEQLVGLLGFERRDVGAAARADLDETRALEGADGLAHRVARHAELLGQAVLDQPLAGSEVTPEHHGADLIGDHLSQRPMRLTDQHSCSLSGSCVFTRVQVPSEQAF